MFCSLCNTWEPCGKKGCWIAEDGWEHRKAKEAGLLRGNAPRKEGVFQVLVRPMNCDSALGTKDRCPHCNQFHLRPGYCQALDPVNKPVNMDVNIATVHGSNVHIAEIQMTKREPEIEPDDDEEDRDARRKRLRREWMRKKRDLTKET